MQKKENFLGQNLRGRRHNHKALQEGSETESGSTAPKQPDGIFRPDLLNYNPTEKSGYSFLKADVHPLKLAIEWLACLEKHEAYIELEIAETASESTVLDILHAETNRLFGEFNWVITQGDEQQFTITYFRNLGDIDNHQLPLKWFNESSSLEFKNCGLWLMKQIASKFKIDYIINDLFDVVLEHKDDPDDLFETLKERYDNGEDGDVFIAHAATSDYLSYVHGKPAQLLKTLQAMPDECPLDFHSDITKLEEPIHNWICMGLELLKSYNFEIYEFDLQPFNLANDDGSPVLLRHALFMPYDFSDYAFQEYESWINDTANSIGTNDIFEYGFITSEMHVPPTNPDGLYKLINFLDEGRRIYFDLEIPKNNPHADF